MTNEAYLVGNRIRLYFPYNPTMIAKIKLIEGRQWHPLEKCWSVPIKNLSLVNKLGFYGIKNKTKKQQDYKEIQIKYPFLYPHQVECVTKGIIEGNLPIFDEMGLGKSLEALVIAKELNKKIIIFCPASIKQQWKNEAKKWLNMDLKVIGGTPKQRVYNHETGIILNYELLSRDYKKIFNYSYKQTIIFDEASYLKNHKAKRTILANKLNAEHCFALTGTPIEIKIRDAFNIGNLVVPNWMSSSEFYNEYCILDKITVKYKKKGKDAYKRISTVSGYCNIPKFMERLAEISIRRLKKDVLQLPPKTVYKRYIPLSPLQHKVGEFIKRELEEAKIEEFIILAVLADGIDLLQLSNSRIANKVKNNFSLKPDSPKVAELLRVIEELDDKKIIIFTRFKKMQKLLEKALPKCSLIGNGDTKDKLGLINEFKNDDNRFLIVTDAFNYGVDMPFGTALINFDIPWNHARLKQREDRIHRLSSKSPVTIINFVSEGMEEYIYDKMMEGHSLAEKFNETVRNFLR